MNSFGIFADTATPCFLDRSAKLPERINPQVLSSIKSLYKLKIDMAAHCMRKDIIYLLSL
jgi:hypothetical protein